MATLPSRLRLPPASPFVGRDAELAALGALVPWAAGEGRRIALIGGEAGSGKSRLVRELAHHVADEGAVVLYGSCDAVIPTAYAPFAEALKQLVRATPEDALRDGLHGGGGELARLLPDLAGDGRGAPASSDPDTERHRLHTAVTDLLVAAGRRAPLLLVIEDGHWADTPSLLLLRHLARAGADARVLVLVTFRDTEADVPADLAEVLADLRRMDDVARLVLQGLSEAEVEVFVRRSVDRDAPVEPGLAGELRALTAGNPFLLCELWRTLLDTGALAGGDGALRLERPLGEIASPQGVREVVGQRLGRLAPTTRELIELAAVAGPEFELDVIRRAAPADLPVDALEPAVRSGVIEELPSQPGAPRIAYRFTHELVRRALYDGLTAARRAALHLRIAEAIEAGERHGSRVLADLAHHFAAAAPICGPERAVEYNLLAAAQASAALAYGEACEHYRTALRVGIPDERHRAETLLALGSALDRAGRSTDSLQAFREAAEIARARSDGELLARAAVGFETSCWRPARVDEGARELLEEASAALDPRDSTLRVEVLGSLARALELQGSAAQADEVRERTIAMARRIGDRHGLIQVLAGSYWSRPTRSVHEILAMLDEARTLAEEDGDIEGQTEAMEWRVAALMASGEIGRAREELGTTRALALHTRQPFMMHVAEHYGSALALLEGDLVEADAAAERSREWGLLLTGRDASGVYGIQMFGVRREQGRLAELAPVMRLLASEDRGDGTWLPAVAAMLAELGMEDQARAQLDVVAEAGLGRFREALWLAALTYLADAASAVSHAGAAALLYPALLPFAGTNVVIGHGVACYGAADRYLGMLAAVLGDDADAERHFDTSMELNRSMGANTWLAHTAYQYGRLCLDRGEEDEARPLLSDAAQLAEGAGMEALLRRTRALLDAPVAVLPDGLSAREVEVLRLAARGLSNREIGTTLFISEHTAANHMRSILRKTSCANRAEATAYAYEHGLTRG